MKFITFLLLFISLNSVCQSETKEKLLEYNDIQSYNIELTDNNIITKSYIDNSNFSYYSDTIITDTELLLIEEIYAFDKNNAVLDTTKYSLLPDTVDYLISYIYEYSISDNNSTWLSATTKVSFIKEYNPILEESYFLIDNELRYSLGLQVDKEYYSYEFKGVSEIIEDWQIIQIHKKL